MATGSSHSCAAPSIWSALPQDVQELVIAHLPLTKIFQLQLLSKKWRDVIKESAKFRKACAENNPHLIALVSELDHDRGTFHIRMYDTKMNKWHSYDMRPTKMLRFFPTQARMQFNYLTASDGGLLCYVPIPTREQPLVIIVCNPLTRELKALPAPSISRAQPRMVQIVMHKDENFYEVMVVSDSRTPFTAHVYNSQTGAWSNKITHSVADYVFGYRYFHYPAFSLIPMVLDCRKQQLLKIPNETRKNLSRVGKIDVVKDRLFTLELTRKASCCSLYRGLYRSSRWSVKEFRRENHRWVVEKKLHQIIPCKEWDHMETSVRFYACTSFLLIVFIRDHADEEQDVTLLYDLCTSSCRTIQSLPERGKHDDDPSFEMQTVLHNPRSIMCELQWHAIP